MNKAEKEIHKRQEYEANVFAVCLLIPKDRLIEEINKMGGFDLSDEKELKKLCKLFGVSSTAMSFRLNLLNE